MKKINKDKFTTIFKTMLVTLITIILILSSFSVYADNRKNNNNDLELKTEIFPENLFDHKTFQQNIDQEKKPDRMPKEQYLLLERNKSEENRSDIGDDNDGDGLGDSLENTLLDTYAPVVFLHPSENRYPCNVEWYLIRSHMRFHHNDCSDCEIIAHGLPNQNNIITQEHRKKKGAFTWPPWDACEHYDNWERSWCDWDEDQCFFLQTYNPAHDGSTNTNDWIVYGHVYPNNFNGINIQYWFFYSYSDYHLGFNHEGDWENIIVELRNDLSVNDIYFYQHGDGKWVPVGDVTWYEDTHPVVMSALGSHASYESYQACLDHTFIPFPERGCYWCSSVECCDRAWFTWERGRPLGSPGFQGGGIVNVGEKYRSLNSQKFTSFSGRWGEIGDTPWTSGPRGPAYQDSWERNVGSLNIPPNIPSNPNPNDGATDVPLHSILTWTGGSPYGGEVIYDVYFGTTNPPSKVSSLMDETYYEPRMLDVSTTYYWKIIAKNRYGLSTPVSGPLWTFTSIEPADVVYVNDDFDLSTPGWGQYRFDRICEAYDSVIEGGTIYIYSGTYLEYLTFDKPINVIGEDRDTAIIDPCELSYDTITISSDYVNISGLTIKNSYSYEASGVYINSNNNIIKENSIFGHDDSGIALMGSQNIIQDNIISGNNWDGISICGSDNIITENSIQDNGGMDPWRIGSGITAFCGASNNEISGNFISYNFIGMYINS